VVRGAQREAVWVSLKETRSAAPGVVRYGRGEVPRAHRRLGMVLVLSGVCLRLRKSVIDADGGREESQGEGDP